MIRRLKMTAIDPKTYAQLASRVYDRKDIRNKMTLPQDFTELGWQDDDPLTGFSANTDFQAALRMRSRCGRHP